MIKKLAVTLGAGSMLLVMVAPALAGFDWNYAYVKNSSKSYANTGANSQGNYGETYGWDNSVDVNADGNRSMTTGTAHSYSGAMTLANTHVADYDCDSCSPDFDIARVYNSAYADSNTGANSQDNVGYAHGSYHDVDVDGDGTRTMNTGKAESESHAWTVVNTHWGM